MQNIVYGIVCKVGGDIVNPVYRFSISKNEEIVADISEGKDLQVFDIRVNLKSKTGEITPTKKGIEIPVSMLPEIRRLLHLLEEGCPVSGLSYQRQNRHGLTGVREVVF